MHKNNTETVWCQSTADVETLEWFLTKLPFWKAFSLKLVDRLVFMFTFTMSPENGKCKFKDELLTMPAYKEWECQDPKGDICSARCQFCTKSIYIGNGGRYSLDCHVKSITHKNNTETDWCHKERRCRHVGGVMMKLSSWKAFSLNLVDRLVFMFTFTMSPENGKYKFKDELLTMAAYKEWVCQDPKGNICSARCQICANSINTRRLLQPGQSC